MSNEAAAKLEHLAVPEAEGHEPSPESGKREKPKTPGSVAEAEQVVGTEAEAVTMEAKTFTADVLTGEHEIAKQPIDAQTELAVQEAAAKAKTAMAVFETVDMPVGEPANDNAVAPEAAKAETGMAVLEEVAAEAPPEAKAETSAVGAPEAANVENKMGPEEVLKDVHGNFGKILNEYASNGMKGLSFDDARRMERQLIGRVHADVSGGDARFTDLSKLMSGLFSEIKSPPDPSDPKYATLMRKREMRIRGIQNEWKAMEEKWSGKAPAAEVGPEKMPDEGKIIGASAPEARVAQRAVTHRAAHETQAPRAAEQAPMPGVETVSKAAAEAMGADEFENQMLANIKGREEMLERLYAISPGQRTEDQQFEIDDMEMLNGMERKSMEKRREEETLKTLEARAAELEAEIAVLGIPEAAPAASTAMELAGAAPSTAMELAKPAETGMILAGEAEVQADALAMKRQQLAEVHASMDATRANIAELGAAVAQLDRIRKRMVKPEPAAKAEETKAEETALAAKAKAASSPDAGAKAAGAEASGSVGASQIEYDTSYTGEQKKEAKKKDGGPDTFDVVLSAMHGEVQPLANKVSKSINKITGDH